MESRYGILNIDPFSGVTRGMQQQVAGGLSVSAVQQQQLQQGGTVGVSAAAVAAAGVPGGVAFGGGPGGGAAGMPSSPAHSLAANLSSQVR